MGIGFATKAIYDQIFNYKCYIILRVTFLSKKVLYYSELFLANNNFSVYFIQFAYDPYL